MEVPNCLPSINHPATPPEQKSLGLNFFGGLPGQIKLIYVFIFMYNTSIYVLFFSSIALVGHFQDTRAYVFCAYVVCINFLPLEFTLLGMGRTPSSPHVKMQHG